MAHKAAHAPAAAAAAAGGGGAPAGSVDWSALSSAAPSIAPSTLLPESVFSSNLTVHSLLREVHLLTLERHTAAAQSLALQAQVAALEANLADSVRMQAVMQGKIQVLEYGLKIERKHNAMLMQSIGSGKQQQQQPQANGHDGSAAAAASGSSHDAAAASPASPRRVGQVYHSLPSAFPAPPTTLEASVDPALFAAYMQAIGVVSPSPRAAADQATLPRSLPAPPAALQNSGKFSSSSDASSSSSSGLSNATSALPSKTSSSAGFGATPGTDEDGGGMNFSYAKTGRSSRQRSSALASSGSSGVDVNATSALPLSSGKPKALTANTFMPPSAEEIEAEISMAKSPPAVHNSVLPGSAGSNATSAASMAAAAADKPASSFKYGGDATPSGGKDATVYNYNTSPDATSALPTFGSGASADSNGTDPGLGQTMFDMRAVGASLQMASVADSSSSAGSDASSSAASGSEQAASGTTNYAAASSAHKRGISGAGTGSAFAGAGGLTSAKQWRPKLQLKSHMDSVRSVCFDRSRGMLNGGTGAPPILLLSGSEDGTAALWNLGAALSAASTPASRKAGGLPAPLPLHTYRGHHRGAVTNVLLHSEQVGAFTAGIDGKVVQWSLPAGSSGSNPTASVDLYASHGSTSVFARRILQHQDAVWSMDVLVGGPMPPAATNDGSADASATAATGPTLLATAVANGDICLWEVDAAPEGEQFSMQDTQQPRIVLHVPLPEGSSSGGDSTGAYAIPTSVQFVPSSGGRLLAVACATGQLALFDVVTGNLEAVCTEPALGAGDNTLAPSTRITSLVAHPTQDLLVTGHTDNSIRFWDVLSRSRVGFLAAHRNIVSCLSLDGSGSHLVSGSHDESIRCWSTSERKIRQVLDTHQTHRLKFQEAIHSVSFHPTQPYLASAGADGIIKLYV